MHVDALPKIVRIAVGYAGKCNWETFGVVASFLLEYASHRDANPGLAWGVVEVLCDRRWEDGKRRRGGEDVVTKCVAAWVKIYEEVRAPVSNIQTMPRTNAFHKSSSSARRTRGR